MRQTPYEVLDVPIGDMTASVFKQGNFAVGSGEILADGVRDSHFHTVFELQYVTRGGFLIRGDGVKFAASAGDLILISPGTFHSSEDPRGLSRYTLLFSLSLNDRRHRGFSEYCHYNRILKSIRGIRVFFRPETQDVIRRITCLGEVTEENHHLLRLYCQLLLTEVLNSIARELPPSGDEVSALPDGAGSPEDERMKFIMENCIHEYFASPGIADALTQALGMSRRNCARVVRRLLGRSLGELVTDQRMRMARALILHTKSTLAEISEAVGYQSYVSFFTAFKKYYGTSPLSLREGMEK